MALEKQTRNYHLAIVSWSFYGFVILALIPAFGLAGDELELARAKVEALPPAEKEQLRQNFKNYCELSPEQQEQLRKLHEQLEQDPDKDELLGVLRSYHEWLKTLNPGEKAELLALSPEKRVERIREIKEEHEKSFNERLGREKISEGDYKAVFGWAMQQVRKHEPDILKDLSEERREDLQRQRPPQRMRTIMALAWSQRDGYMVEKSAISEDDLKLLMKQLSREARQRLEREDTHRERVEMIGRWVRMAWQGRGFPGRFWSPVTDEQLARFLKQMNPDERKKLLDMPRDQMQRRLREMYRDSQGGRPQGPGGERASRGGSDGPPPERGDERPRRENRN